MSGTAAEPGWYGNAGVRKDPRRVLRDGLDDGQVCFPLRLVPYWEHPLVTALAPRRREELLARHLFQYLEFTSHFETRVVNRATERIAEGHAGGGTRERLGAYQIYCDEAYHSLYNLDVVCQISAASGIPPLTYDFEPFATRLDQVGERLMPGETELAQLLQVVVFETLITAVLNDVPRDPRVLDLVRVVIRDHARDEGRHHAFFSAFFRDLWVRQDPAVRTRAARCLPQLIRGSLLPYIDPLRDALGEAGLDPPQTEEVLHDSYPIERLEAEMRSTARHTVQLFEETGVLDVPGGRDAFAQAHLLP